MPPKGRVKVKFWDTTLEQIKDIQIGLRKQYPKLKEIITERQDNISIGQDRENKLDIGDVRDINYQNNLLKEFLERNVDNCLVTNKYVLDYFEGRYPHCYNGYFYVSEEKMLTPIYMLAQKAIDKVIKYVKVKNESNKKIKRT